MKATMNEDGGNNDELSTDSYTQFRCGHHGRHSQSSRRRHWKIKIGGTIVGLLAGTKLSVVVRMCRAACS